MPESSPAGEPGAGDAAAARGRSLWRLLQACLIVLALSTAAGFLARLSWFLELFSHYRAHYVLCAALALALFAIGRKWGWAVLAAVLLAVNALPVLPLYYGREELPAKALPLRLLFANLHYGSVRSDRFLDLISARDPDVVLLAELTEGLLRELAPLRHDYPVMSVAPREGPLGLAFFSRVACPASHMMRFEGCEMLTFVGRLQLDGRDVLLVGAHTLPPLGPAWARERDTQFAAMADLVRVESGPVIVLGDLNCTPYSPYFRRLLQDAGLQDGRRGFGAKATWPAILGPLGLPIDQCLVGGGVVVTDFQVGPDIGSDHRPIIIDVVIP
jgi:endonuclease/exonuclease/phosphatase (EEP) superfamily protein YafD